MRQINQRKRHQEESSVKQNEAKSQNKRQKTAEHKDKETSVITESAPGKDDKENSGKETVDGSQEIADKEAVANTKETLSSKEVTVGEAANREVDNQDEEDDDGDDDPEEDPEECEEMDVANSEQDNPAEEV